MSNLLLPYDAQLWDWAGVDGLQLGRSLFGAAVSHLAPFQSLEARLEGSACSVLRLGETNFRVRLPEGLLFEQAIAPIRNPFDVWVKPCTPMAALTLSAPCGLERLISIAMTKPIYRLQAIAPNCAMPARIDGKAVLIWRHAPSEEELIELHVAKSDREEICDRLIGRETGDRT